MLQAPQPDAPGGLRAGSARRPAPAGRFWSSFTVGTLRAREARRPLAIAATTGRWSRAGGRSAPRPPTPSPSSTSPPRTGGWPIEQDRHYPNRPANQDARPPRSPGCRRRARGPAVTQRHRNCSTLRQHRAQSPAACFITTWPRPSSYWPDLDRPTMPCSRGDVAALPAACREQHPTRPHTTVVDRRVALPCVS